MRNDGISDLTTSGDAPLVSGSGATLRLTDCQLSSAGGGPSVVVRGGELRLNASRLYAAATAVAVEADNPAVIDRAAGAFTQWTEDFRGSQVNLPKEPELQLAFAASRLHQPLEELVKFDATWSDRRTGAGDVIDFSEWVARDYWNCRIPSSDRSRSITHDSYCRRRYPPGISG
jgi:hypothetical protein